MKIFKFLKGHILNLVLALVLLCIQANCELTLPGLMSDIVDVGISQGGIDSSVPNEIRASDLEQVELFLSDDEAAQVEAVYSAGSGDAVRTFVDPKRTVRHSRHSSVKPR